MKKDHKIIGKKVSRVDALDKVTGSAKYVDDIQFPGMLHARILRSPHPHADLISVDLSAAKKLPGVKAAICGRDFPFNTGIYHVDQYMFAMERVRYVGEPVAAVSAVSPEIAEEALKLIKVKYKPLKANYDPGTGMIKGATLIHPNLHKYKHVSAINPTPHTNIANHFKIRKGEPEKAFKKASHVFENYFNVPQIQHVPLETHGAVAVTERSGKTTVWSSCQSPFTVRYLLSHCFSKKLTDFRVIAPYIGGGFGCKAGINIEPITVALSMKTPGKPVKLILTREEEMCCIVVRQACQIRIKSGVTKEGRIIAQENEYIWDCGAYAGYGVNIVRAAGYSVCGAYDIENLKGDSIGVYTNRPVGSAFRGFGMSEIHWGIEQHMDMMAQQLGIDPVEFRLKNILKKGSHTATGELITENTGNMEHCIAEVMKNIDYNKKRGPYRAVGLALAQKAPAMPNNASSASIVKFNESGEVELLFSGMEIGQGVMTAMAMIAAETLQIPLDHVHVVGLPDTDYSPYEWQTVASRLTYSCGNAVCHACGDAISQMKGIASQVFGLPVKDIDYKDGVFICKKIRVPIDQICMGYQFPDGHTIGGAIVGRGHFTTSDCINCDPETGYSPKPVANWTFGCQAVDLEVNPDTGELTLHKVACTYDVGCAINPSGLMGQVYGGIVQGSGAGLMEQLVLDETTGRVRNQSLVDYKVPTIMDIPAEFQASFVETAQKDGAYGARGIGEHTMIPTPAAIANALYKATGLRIQELPITAEKVLDGLLKLQKAKEVKEEKEEKKKIVIESRKKSINPGSQKNVERVKNNDSIETISKSNRIEDIKKIVERNKNLKKRNTLEQSHGERKKR
ncbi:MAG: xanthine dehydrogenase family protein molybdopterin-binding subunit [Candidatus Wallbacteria bacterium]|nr:xanthine dehydrogenase family protein molybdopterin-binding subunit [Candidatus Wallbacteria bacterium]